MINFSGLMWPWVEEKAIAVALTGTAGSMPICSNPNILRCEAREVKECSNVLLAYNQCGKPKSILQLNPATPL